MDYKPSIVEIFGSMHTGIVSIDMKDTLASILYTSWHSAQLVFTSVI